MAALSKLTAVLCGLAWLMALVAIAASAWLGWMAREVYKARRAARRRKEQARLGTIKIYAGTRPADADTAITNATLLSETQLRMARLHEPRDKP